jgi:ComF family protein
MDPERLWLWFFPRRCVWCAGVCAPEAALCARCAGKAGPVLEPDLLPESNYPLVSVFTYHSRARKILLNLKFHGQKNLAHSIGYAMADAIAGTPAFTQSKLADKPGWLFCAVPMTPAGVKARGYNHSELLARAAARWLGMDYAPGLLVKTRETPAQHGLPKHERLTNVSGVFAAAEEKLIWARKIVLCDDICTTGATLREAARVLQEAGAKEIVCLTYLRTDLEEENYAS